MGGVGLRRAGWAAPLVARAPVARERRSNRVSVKAIRRPYHMKGWVGVVGPKMSPRRIAPLSNSRRFTKGPFTGPLLPPANTHSLHPALPSRQGPFRASHRGHRIGGFPL